jgi:hypothetical protein
MAITSQGIVRRKHVGGSALSALDQQAMVVMDPRVTILGKEKQPQLRRSPVIEWAIYLTL